MRLSASRQALWRAGMGSRPPWLKEDILKTATGVCVSHPVVTDSCHPMDWSPPGSSVHGILQARILEWVAISSSRPRDLTRVSYAGRQTLYH